ncbi:MAG: multicopper oxidase domain-containing protein [Candidatus Nitrosopolaris sp.]
MKKSIFRSVPIKKVFILGLSAGLVMGIITSTFLFLPVATHTSFSYLSKDAKAISSSVYGRSPVVHQEHVTLEVEQASVMLKDGDNASVWTFNGTVPGPTLRFKEGDKVTIHLINNDREETYHTVHLHVDHAAKFDGIFDDSVAYGKPNATAGKSNSTDYTFIAEPAGAFPYHCHSMSEGGTSMHMRMGMYGLMIIDPKVPLQPAREYGIVMGEYSDIGSSAYKQYPYGSPKQPRIPVMFDSVHNKTLSQGGDPLKQNPEPSYQLDPRVILPKYFLNNGYFDQYLHYPLPAWTGETVRLYVVNDGVGLVYPFHLHAQIFKAYPSGLISGDGWSNKPEYRQTVLIGPGDAAIIEISWPAPGSYLFHAHGIEEENGGMGCIYVVNRTTYDENKIAACGDPPSHLQSSNIIEIKKAYPSITTQVTNKTGSISMIEPQYLQQIARQHPICTVSDTPGTGNSKCVTIPSPGYLKAINYTSG